MAVSANRRRNAVRVERAMDLRHAITVEATMSSLGAVLHERHEQAPEGGNRHHRANRVASLAAEVGVSRATLARRFTDLVGEPPMSFLTGWRLALAADLLREPGSTIAAVANQVGYGSPYALSIAFKRAYGVSPKAHRLAAS